MQQFLVARARRLQVRPGRQPSGFTLIELMITLAIVAILAAVAYPSYLSQVRKGRRSDAIAAINEIQQAQERWRANNSTYTATIGSGGLNLAHLQTTSRDGYYTLAITGNTGTAYTLTATAVSGKSQANDTGCTALVMTVANGNGTPTPTACWSR